MGANVPRSWLWLLEGVKTWIIIMIISIMYHYVLTINQKRIPYKFWSKVAYIIKQQWYWLPADESTKHCISYNDCNSKRSLLFPY